jgi:hypothetical protein
MSRLLPVRASATRRGRVWLLACFALSGCGESRSTSVDGSTSDASIVGGGDAATRDAFVPDDPPPEGRVFDHRHAVSPAAIPDACIDHLRSGAFVFHYGHRSHGSQITVGAELLEDLDDRYAFDGEYCEAPNATGVFPMWDGMTPATGATVVADQYWSDTGGVDELRAILGENPSIRYTSWAWSYDLIDQTSQSIQLYLDTMSALELEFPNVTFVYMTGPADAGYDDATHRMRAGFNDTIRAFCTTHGKTLFDFEDLDAWSDGVRSSRVIDGVDVPTRHADYAYGDEAGYQGTHTTVASCLNKARAFWWMMATLEGCVSP